MNTRHPSILPFSPRRIATLLAAGVFALGSPDAAQAQDWQTPYASGSAADLALRFSNGATGSARSPSIPFALGLSVNDTTPGIGSGGGWGLSATGTATMGVGFLIVGETHTQTTAGGGSLIFEMDTEGVNDLVGLSMGSKWLASTTIAGSDSWATPTNNFRYTFDIAVSSDILSLSPGFFSNYGLTIQAGSDILFQGTLSSIIPTLAPIVTGASVEFAYDPSAGPLQISWTGDGTVNTSLLGLLGDGSNTILQVTNGAIQVDAIPEPGTYGLLAASLGAMAFFRRHRRR